MLLWFLFSSGKDLEILSACPFILVLFWILIFIQESIKHTE